MPLGSSNYDPFWIFRWPFSGNVNERITAPWFSPSLTVNYAGDARIEDRVVTEVASYGKQLGCSEKSPLPWQRSRTLLPIHSGPSRKGQGAHAGGVGRALGIQPTIHQRPRAGSAQSHDRQHLRAGNRPRRQPHGARAPNRGAVSVIRASAASSRFRLSSPGQHASPTLSMASPRLAPRRKDRRRQLLGPPERSRHGV
jgi:hypothetical protein